MIICNFPFINGEKMFNIVCSFFDTLIMVRENQSKQKKRTKKPEKNLKHVYFFSVKSALSKFQVSCQRLLENINRLTWDELLLLNGGRGAI